MHESAQSIGRVLIGFKRTRQDVVPVVRDEGRQLLVGNGIDLDAVGHPVRRMIGGGEHHDKELLPLLVRLLQNLLRTLEHPGVTDTPRAVLDAGIAGRQLARTDNLVEALLRKIGFDLAPGLGTRRQEDRPVARLLVLKHAGEIEDVPAVAALRDRIQGRVEKQALERREGCLSHTQRLLEDKRRIEFACQSTQRVVDTGLVRLEHVTPHGLHDGQNNMRLRLERLALRQYRANLGNESLSI